MFDTGKARTTSMRGVRGEVNEALGVEFRGERSYGIIEGGIGYRNIHNPHLKKITY